MHSQPSQIEYQKRLAEGLSTDGSARILAFKNKVAALIADVAIISEEAPLSPLVPDYQVCQAQSFASLTRLVGASAQAPEPPKGYENAMTALYSRNAAPRPVRKTARCLPQVRSFHRSPACRTTALPSSCISHCCTLRLLAKREQNKVAAAFISKTVWSKLRFSLHTWYHLPCSLVTLCTGLHSRNVLCWP